MGAAGLPQPKARRTGNGPRQKIMVIRPNPDAKLFHLRGQASDVARAPAAVVDDVQRIDAFGDIAQGGAGDAGTIAFDGQGKVSRRSAGELLEIPEALGGTERAV